MERQSSAEYTDPAQITHRNPLGTLHGGGETGSNFTGTTDGRKGWAEFFVERGYTVYIVDQPARGRSASADGFSGWVPRQRSPAVMGVRTRWISGATRGRTRRSTCRCGTRASRV